jgi:hypothetical protein
MTDEEIETFEEAMDEQTKIERWIVTLWCPLAPRLFTPRFRQGDGTLVAHEKAWICVRIKDLPAPIALLRHSMCPVLRFAPAWRLPSLPE